MDKIFSTRVDEAVIHRIGSLARRLLHVEETRDRGCRGNVRRPDRAGAEIGRFRGDFRRVASKGIGAADGRRGARGVPPVYGAAPAMRAYVDADVSIGHLRGERKSPVFLRGLRADPECELWTGALQRAEVLFFMRPDEEEQTLLLPRAVSHRGG